MSAPLCNSCQRSEYLQQGTNELGMQPFTIAEATNSAFTAFVPDNVSPLRSPCEPPAMQFL